MPNIYSDNGHNTIPYDSTIDRIWLKSGAELNSDREIADSGLFDYTVIYLYYMEVESGGVRMWGWYNDVAQAVDVAFRDRYPNDNSRWVSIVWGADWKYYDPGSSSIGFA